MASRPTRRPVRHRFAPRVERAEPRLLLSTLGVDNRLPVAQTTAYPFNAIVHLEVQFPNGKWFSGSGAMIDSTHVLTVAHNIFNRANGGWAKVVDVLPGQFGASYPLGAYKAVRETIYTDYALHESHGGRNFNLDLAQLRLATPVMPAVGALGREVRDDAYFRTASVTTSGYPGDLPAGSPHKGDVMYTAAGRTTFAGSHIVHYSIPTARGQSGSPIYRTDATGTYVDAVVSYGLPAEADPSYNNGAVRITPIVAADLKTWGIVDSVANPSVVFAHAVLPHDPVDVPGGDRLHAAGADARLRRARAVFV